MEMISTRASFVCDAHSIFLIPYSIWHLSNYLIGGFGFRTNVSRFMTILSVGANSFSLMRKNRGWAKNFSTPGRWKVQKILIDWLNGLKSQSGWKSNHLSSFWKVSIQSGSAREIFVGIAFRTNDVACIVVWHHVLPAIWGMQDGPQSITRMWWFQGKPNPKMRSHLGMSSDESIACRRSFLDHTTLLTSPQHACSADHGPIASMKKSWAVGKGMRCQVSEMQFSCVTDSTHPTYNTENLLRYIWGFIVGIMGAS
jgi:hypothetical protein